MRLLFNRIALRKILLPTKSFLDFIPFKTYVVYYILYTDKPLFHKLHYIESSSAGFCHIDYSPVRSLVIQKRLLTELCSTEKSDSIHLFYSIIFCLAYVLQNIFCHTESGRCFLEQAMTSSYFTYSNLLKYPSPQNNVMTVSYFIIQFYDRSYNNLLTDYGVHAGRFS